MSISGNVDNDQSPDPATDTDVTRPDTPDDGKAAAIGNDGHPPHDQANNAFVTARAPRRPLAPRLAVALALIATALAAYATWRVVLIERSERNLDAEHARRLDAVDSRITGVERNAERNNQLATTLRDQLAETERLNQRMREDVVTLGDRNARSESLLAELARNQHGSRQDLAVIDAASLIDQADRRLRLFGDRTGAVAALALAGQQLEQAGARFDSARRAIAEAGSTLTADPRPSSAALLGELDDLANALAGLPTDTQRQRLESTPPSDSGWWARQFSRIDHLVSIRREDDPVVRALPGKDGARLAINRARLAALEQDHAALPDALRSARASLQACCGDEVSAPLISRIDRLLGIDWQAAQPDLAALRALLTVPAAPDTTPAPATDAEADAEAGVDDSEEHAP